MVNVTFAFGLIVCFLGFLAVWLVYYFWKVRGGANLDRTPVTMISSAGKEGREHPRADVNWSVSLETPDGTVAAQVKNISAGGAFICCSKPLPVGEMFHLTMTGPDREPVKATAKVVWSNVNVPEDKVINRGMGIRFINMSNQHIRLVRDVCQETA